MARARKRRRAKQPSTPEKGISTFTENAGVSPSSSSSSSLISVSYAGPCNVYTPPSSLITTSLHSPPHSLSSSTSRTSINSLHFCDSPQSDSLADNMVEYFPNVKRKKRRKPNLPKKSISSLENSDTTAGVIVKLRWGGGGSVVRVIGCDLWPWDSSNSNITTTTTSITN